MSEENDTRKQIEDDQTEDLQLESEDADDVGQRSAADQPCHPDENSPQNRL